MLMCYCIIIHIGRWRAAQSHKQSKQSIQMGAPRALASSALFLRVYAKVESSGSQGFHPKIWVKHGSMPHLST